ncbi:MAG TPA: acyl-CoA carboxylase subunit beta [Chitinophagales bacterium]|jgi:acetyl-CoA carboxylase carboxyltransferase component|nr:acyl-CoA carboxylase subunit beta [Chitinophagales bacterium]HQO89853.1 acyl-CoA carboxylase subunit beta [Chitinophagales bacterium]
MTDLEFNKNEDAMRLAVDELKAKLQKVYLGGGLKKIESEHKKGKMTARERIAYLIDKNTTTIEIGALVGDEMYAAEGGCPSGGVVTVIGYVSGRQCMIVANDATVKAGAWFPITGKKNLRAQEIAMENRLPVIYLVDSAGVFLPMQDEIFPDKENFGRIFRNNAKMSSMGIPQISAIMGSCVAGGAYLPIMSDESLIVEGTGSIFLAGPYLVKSAIGENVDKETLGGAVTQTAVSGVCDYKMKDDKECLDTIKKLIDKYGRFENAGFDRVKPKKPKKHEKDIYGIFSSAKPYDVREIIERLADNSEYTEYKEDYGQTIVCAYARIDGWSVGIVANQRSVVKSKKGEVQIGGVIYSDAADKAARFIMLCNQKKIPLVFLQDVTGFMVGSRSEHGGIIKDGAKLVSAVSNSTVPKFTIVTGNSYGAGNYAMCGKAYDPRLIVAWPSAKIAVMGGDQAAKTILQIQVAAVEAKGNTLSDEEKEKILKEIRDHYNKTTSAYYAAARLWVDAVIDPLETRHWISTGIEAANNAPVEKFNVGVLQT